MSQESFGLLGIFSTDDPGADLRQLEAEQYEPWSDEEPFDDELYTCEIQVVCACCVCNEVDLMWIDDDEISLAHARADWTKKHAKLNPDCKGTAYVEKID